MREGLLLIERIIIESISKKEKNIFELEIDTSLNQALLLNILPNLLMKNLIRYNRGIYSIDKESSLKWLETINEKENIKEELKEMFAALVNKYYQEDLKSNINSTLKVQKVWLTADEELILNSHLATIDCFFKNIKEQRKSNPHREKTYDQKVIIWGTSKYSEIVMGSLLAV
jgi:hypothetical protein